MVVVGYLPHDLIDTLQVFDIKLAVLRTIFNAVIRFPKPVRRVRFPYPAPKSKALKISLVCFQRLIFFAFTLRLFCRTKTFRDFGTVNTTAWY